MKRLGRIAGGLAVGTALTSSLVLGACTGCTHEDNPVNNNQNGGSEENFDPTQNMEPAVYGPPEYFGFDPEENEPIDVYGPPSALS